MKSLDLILLILSILLLITRISARSTPVIPGPCPQFFVGCRPGQPNDTIDCTDDLECDHNQRCCDSPCNGKMCFDTGDRLKPGQCNDFAGIKAKCMEGAYENSTAQCHQDGDCPGDQKCCPQLCVKDLCKPPMPEPAQLVCPKPKKDLHCPPGQEKKACVSDSECGLKRKCCDSGCGYNKCKKPVPQPLCVPVTECKIFCPFGSVPDTNGCHTCECNPDPCLSTTCPEGQHCETAQVECFAPPCPPQPSCVNNTRCGPLCLMFCKFGNVLDERGCPICKCNPDPCENFTCSEGQHCEAHQVFCIGASCPSYVPACENNTKSCPGLCKMFCEYGFVHDNNSCPICECVQPCKDIVCGEGRVCKPKRVECVTEPCNAIGVCVNNVTMCPDLLCDLDCTDGHVYDEDNCPTCECYQPCKNLNCSVDQVCRSHNVTCITAPCYPVGECVSATSTTGMCVVGSGPCPVVDQSRIACAEPANADRLDQCGLCSDPQICCPHPCPGFGMRCVHPD